jgi:Ca2+-transporting ATPase
MKDIEVLGTAASSGLLQTPPRDNKFGFTVDQLWELVDSRSLTSFHALGGLTELESALRSDLHSGLSADESVLEAATLAESEKHFLTSSIITARSPVSGDAKIRLFADRKQVFGDNHLPMKTEPNFLHLMWMAYNDYVLFLLTGAAVISLALGLYQALATPHTPDNPPVEWVEGVAILVAIIIIVLVGALNDFQKQHQFRKLNKKQQDRDVKVVRSGRPQEIPIYDIVVGDVVQVEPGDVIPADGILIRGHHIQCDESMTTGESNLRLKCSGDDAFLAVATPQTDIRDVNLDPFIISGTKVAEGIGSFLVIATGSNSSYGRILQTLDEEPGPTPLQERLTKLAKHIAICGGIAALIFFVILFIRFLADLPNSSRTPAEKGQLFLNIFIIALTVVVIAVPEGLPLAVTLSLAFATTRMLQDNNLVRALRACETMGNATTICSDKTGTLTQNRMTVVTATIGKVSSTSPVAQEEVVPFPIAEYIQSFSPDVKSILKQSIAVNTTAFEADDAAFIGSRTESALLNLARDFLGMGPVQHERANTKIVHLIPFDASRQCMITVVQLETDKYRAYIKGASEVLLRRCASVLENPATGASSIPMTDDATRDFEQIIANYASRSLRTISLAYRDFVSWPPKEATARSDSDVSLEEILQDLTCLGVAGIKDPLRDGVQDAIQVCQKAGVVVRMVTGDNLLTARAIAEDTGILTGPEDITMEGSKFRSLNKAQQIEIVPYLKVLARSTPEDKRILVVRLKDMGEIVAVTGDGTNDAPALTAADVGFSMGLSGTEIAREASSIVLMDDNFTSIVKAIMWGRAVNDAVKKFLQVYVIFPKTYWTERKSDLRRL